MSKNITDKTVLSFRMSNKAGESKQVFLSMSLETNVRSMLFDMAKSNKISPDLQARWILMKKYRNWDAFAQSANTNCRSMNMEAKKIITDYFSAID